MVLDVKFVIGMGLVLLLNQDLHYFQMEHTSNVLMVVANANLFHYKNVKINAYKEIIYLVKINVHHVFNRVEHVIL